MMGHLVLMVVLAVSSTLDRLGAKRLALAISSQAERIFRSYRPFVLLGRSSLYERNGRVDDAIACLRQGRQSATAPFVFTSALARLLENAGNKEAAREEYRRLLSSPDADPAFLDAIRTKLSELEV